MGKEKPFIDYLNILPKQKLFEILNKSTEKKIISTTLLISEITTKYSDAKFLENLVKSFNKNSFEVFRTIFLEGSNGIDITSLQKRQTGIKEDAIGEILTNLQNKILIYGVRSNPYKYYIFKEIRELLNNFFTNYYLKSIRKIKLVKSTQTFGNSLFRDTVILLLSLLRERVKKTKNNTLNRKQLENLLKNLENNYKFLDFENGKYPFLFKIVIGFLSSKKLIEDSEIDIRITGKGEKWLESDVKIETAEWYDYILHLCGVEKTDFLLTLLKETGSVVYLEDIISIFDKNEKEVDKELPQFLYLLHLAGIIDIAENGRKSSGCSVTKRGLNLLQRQDSGDDFSCEITIMPTFEILVPRIIKPAILKTLFLICDIVKIDSMLTLKISKESLYNAFNIGVIPDRILENLNLYSVNRIPQNVLFSLKEWLDGYGALAFEMHFILRVKRPELYNKVKGILSRTTFVEEELPDIGFSINSVNYHEVFTLLSKLGISIKPFMSAKGQNREIVKNRETILDTYISIKESSNISDPNNFIIPSANNNKNESKVGGVGKYDGKFKSLPYNELIHVLNYSILMEEIVEIGFKNSSSKMGILPIELELNISEPKIHGKNYISGEALEILIDDIEKIRVRK